nr:type II toxin-antitoxin system RelE/ParE family toxin [uncultured Mucilaginibacter sp.]
MVKRLIVSRTAYLHIDRIIDFNDSRNQSSKYSRKFVKSLFKQLERLKIFPYMGIETGRKDTHLLIWDDFYIYYEVMENAVEIKSIYHQKEDITR